MNDIRRVLSYNDVLLIPRYSGNLHVEDASIVYHYKNLPSPFKAIPITNSPMDMVCSPEMMHCLHNKFNFVVTIHRYFPTAKDQLRFIDECNLKIKNDYRKVFIGVGSVYKWKDWIDYLIRKYKKEKYPNFSIHVDMANGDSLACIETVKYIRKKLPKINIMAGCIATKSGYKRLYKAGASLIRAGIGSGSICSTRIKCGFGIPVLTSVVDCAKFKPEDSYLIADGGIEEPGDIVKAIAAGADMVTMGKMFASTNLAPGLKYDKNLYITENEEEYEWVQYRGMASKEARQNSGCRKNSSLEGVSGLVRYKGTTVEIVEGILENVKAAVSYYGGCKNLKEFQRETKFCEITQAGWAESLTRIKTE